MTRRRSSPPSHKPNPSRSTGKNRVQDLDNELRLARAVRKAESVQKQRLRRGEWDEVDDDFDQEPNDIGEDLSESVPAKDDDDDEDVDDNGEEDR